MKNVQIKHTKDGKKQKIILKADNKIDITNICSSKNSGMIVKLGEKTRVIEQEQLSSIKDKILSLFISPKLPTTLLISCIKQLSVMSRAGIAISDAINEVASSNEDKRVKIIFKQIAAELNHGSSLLEAITPFKAQVTDITLALIRLGESTGNMGESLEKLAQILQDINKNEQDLKRATRYPIIITFALVVAFIIMVTFIVPKFKDVFDSFNAQLPLATRALIWIENFFSDYGIFILVFFTGVLIYAKRSYAKIPTFKNVADKINLKIYLIGKIVFYSNISRFCMIFTELIRAGIPISSALDTATQTLSNEALKQKLSSISVLVSRGVSLTQSFKQTQLFENMIIAMINAAEQSGNLEDMLTQVSDHFKSKFENIINSISSYIEPILLLVLAVMVAFMALGIFMPMWDMSQAIKS